MTSIHRTATNMMTNIQSTSMSATSHATAAAASVSATRSSAKLTKSRRNGPTVGVALRNSATLTGAGAETVKRIKCLALPTNDNSNAASASKLFNSPCSCSLGIAQPPQQDNKLESYEDSNNNNDYNPFDHSILSAGQIGPQEAPLELSDPRLGSGSGTGGLSEGRPLQNNLKQHNPIQTLTFGERNKRTLCQKHMPWFGIDVGGSLVKVVFFDPELATREELTTLRRIRRYLKSSKPYGSTGKRDTHLEMANCLINGRAGSLHFIRFATSEMPEFLAMARSKRFADTINTICATGGGACKFEEDIKSNLGITLHKTDELDSIIHGIHYIDKHNSTRECYFLQDPLDDERCVKVPYDFSRPYPYLVVNIGSGVSILAVYSATSYSRISGSSIGGGTFLGLCCLLAQCETFDEAIRLARAGCSTKVDKLVKDIYGGDYPKFNLSANTVASSFGNMNMSEKRKQVKREDLARALLEMVTINIGSIARMCAVNEGIDRVVFIGNFLRVNQLSMKLLSYAVNYWSKGAIRALFLEHEGYFGAVGCFVESTQGCNQC